MADAPSSAPSTSPFRHFDANPVWVKDLRQASRNPLVTGLLNLLLVGFLLACIAIVLSNEGYMDDSYAGQPVFGIIGGVTIGASFLFIPIYFFVRTLMERISINSDLLYITQMTPRQIIRGKFLSAAYLVLLFYSTAFPFLAFSYVLRGVDLPTIAVTAVMAYGLNLLATFIAIIWALLPWGNAAKVITLVLLLLGMFLFFVGTNSFFFFAGPRAITFSVNPDGEFWFESALALFNYLLLLGMLYQWTVALVTTPSANKSFPVRLYFTVWAVLALLQFYGFAWFKEEEEFIYVGLGILTGAIFAGYFFCIGYQDMPITDRIRRGIPSGTIQRPIAFLFSNGKYTGLLWLTLLWGLALGSLLAFHLLWEVFKKNNFGYWGRDLPYLYLGYSNIILYGLGYALLANGLEKMISPNRRLAPLLFLLLVFLPPLFISIVSMGNFPEHLPFVLFTVFSDEEFLPVHLAWSLILVIGCHAGSRNWIKHHFTRFYELPKKGSTLAKPENE